MKRLLAILCLVTVLAASTYAGEGIIWADGAPTPTPTPSPDPRAAVSQEAGEDSIDLPLLVAALRSFLFIL